MTLLDPLAKRVKRHVIGPSHGFFAATAPGMEHRCLYELNRLALPLQNVRAVPGGVEFTGRLPECYAANLLLRIPNRILMRLAEFKATNFRQLAQQLSRIPWELFIHPDVKRTFHIRTLKSRLYHKAAIAEVFEQSIGGRLKSTAPAPGASQADALLQRIFIRVKADRVGISLDSSGDLLFKRGLKKQVGKAPLRETIAAAILSRAGYNGTAPLMDPMCGSGTFSLEAAMIAGRIPPGWYRRFIFMTWPAFKQKQWQHLKNVNAPPQHSPADPMVFAADTDAVLCSRLDAIAQQFGLSDTIQVLQRDFFDWTPAEVTRQKGLVVLNPPFGVRMAAGRITAGYYIEILRKLKKDYAGWNVALLMPETVSAEEPFKTLSPRPVYHGGLSLSLILAQADTLDPSFCLSFSRPS